VRLAKQNLGWSTTLLFYIPEKAGEHFRKEIVRGKSAETEWRDRFTAYSRAFPDLAKAFQQVMNGKLPDGWDRDIPAFPADAKGVATRVAAGNDLVWRVVGWGAHGGMMECHRLGVAVAHIELLPCHRHWHTSRGASHVTKNRAAWEIAARRPTFRSS
jgi:Transketolase, thiamine diphosphate binding domain